MGLAYKMKKYKKIFILTAPVWLPCVYMVFSYFAKKHHLGYSSMGAFLSALMWFFKAIQIILYMMAVKILYTESVNKPDGNAMITIGIYTILSIISIIFFGFIVGFIWLESMWMFLIYFHWGW